MIEEVVVSVEPRGGTEAVGGAGDASTPLPLLRSTLIPSSFRHGFTTRLGGVSVPPFDTLNLGGRWGDRAEAVAENQRRLSGAAGGRPIFFASQVHGRDSTSALPGMSREEVAAIRADAVVAPKAGVAVGVFTADCVPVLIADLASGACAAVHAGWRGTVAGIVAATIQKLITEFGARAADLRVAIGPSIGPCCFEVGPEVVTAVEAAYPTARARGAVIDPASPVGKPHVDLWRLNHLSAEQAGVTTAHIDVAQACTACAPERFFSYRRDRGHTGQLAAFIVREPADG